MLFLDEPTIGLDVTAQASIREFIQTYNRNHQATVLLTSHYMADVTALATRILVIDRGRLMYDGDLRALVERLAPYRLLRLTLSQPVDPSDLARLGKVAESDGLKVTIQTPRAATKEAAARALTTLPVADVSVEDPPVDEIIREVFRSGIDVACCHDRAGSGPLSSLLFTYRRLIGASWALAVEYRAQFIFYILSFFFPLIMMAVWLAVVREAGPIAGWTGPDFVSYYIGAAVVDHLTVAWFLWDWDDDIRTGAFSMRLVRPLDPLHHYVSSQFGWKIFILLVLVPPVVLIALASPGYRLSVDSGPSRDLPLFSHGRLRRGDIYVGCLRHDRILVDAGPQPLFAVDRRRAIPLGLDRAAGALSSGDSGFGDLAAVPGDPRTANGDSDGRALEPSETAFGLAVSLVWMFVFFIVYRLLWMRGVRRYEAVGG